MSNQSERLNEPAAAEQPVESGESEAEPVHLSVTPADISPAARQMRGLPLIVEMARHKPARVPLDDLRQSVENLAETEALSRVAALRERAEQTYFELGAILSLIRRKGWFAEYGSFKKYVQREFGKGGYRSALHFLQIYEAAAEIGLSHASFKHLGWTVMRLLVPILTKDNAADWIALAGRKSRRELEELIAVQAALTKAGPPDPPKLAHARKLGFSPKHRPLVDKALGRAKNQSGREDELDQLAYICELYVQQPSLSERLLDLPAASQAKLVRLLIAELDENELPSVLDALTNRTGNDRTE